MIELYFHLVHECKSTPFPSKGNTFIKQTKTKKKQQQKNVDIKISAHDAYME